ncbi:MAG TPA: hypothetical protein PLW81_06910 [Thiobacillaceae bacterium]|nr:hypothetical protein [Thiobacillaceae bacterium]
MSQSDESTMSQGAQTSKATLSILTVSLNCLEHFEITATSLPDVLPDWVEWIVVDGKSTDGTAESVGKDKRVTRWISEKDAGVYDAYNKALSLSASDYVMYLNCGDALCEHALDFIFTAIHQKNTHSLQRSVHCFPIRMLASDGYIWKPLPTDLGKAMTVPTPGVIFPRESLLAIDGFDDHLRVAADYEVLLRLSQLGHPFSVHNGVVVNYIGGGISSDHQHLAFFEECVVQLRHHTVTGNDCLLRAARRAVQELAPEDIPYKRWRCAIRIGKKLLY